MDMTDLGHHERRLGGPFAGIEGLAVDPLRRAGVAGHLHVLLELLVPDGPPLGQECLDLGDDEGVALEGGGVMGFLIPDRGPDALGLGRRWQAPHALSEIGNGVLEALVDQLARWAPSP